MFAMLPSAPNGELRAYDVFLFDQSSTADRDGRSFYIEIDPGTGAVTSTGDSDVETFHVAADNTVQASNTGMVVEAIAIGRIGTTEQRSLSPIVGQVPKLRPITRM